MATQKPSDIKAMVQAGIEFDRTQRKNSDDWQFDLEQFQNDAAAACKFLIRAREQHESGFLGPAAIYLQWKLENIANDRESCRILLTQAQNAARKVLNAMQEMGGSGGVRNDDPLGDFKCTVADFIQDGKDLDDAIEFARVEQLTKIKWTTIARWHKLTKIREVLDELFKPASVKLTQAPFDGPCDPDCFCFNGQRHCGLSPIPYRLLKRLFASLGRAMHVPNRGDVWDVATNVSDDQFRSAVRQLKRFLQKKKLPFILTTSTASGSLTATLDKTSSE